MGSYVEEKHGQKCMPAVIDEVARDNPDRACFSFPRDDSDLSKGYEDLSMARWANAINQLAWFIESKLGRSTIFEAFVYLGRQDIRYQTIQMAAAKTGHQVLFSSHSNSLPGHLALMEKCDCKAMLSASGVAVDDILAARPMPHFLIPELDDLISAPLSKPYPFTKTLEEAENDPYLILHTSGSTGLPKPVVYNHGGMAAVDRTRNLPDIDEVSGLRRNFWCTHSQQRILSPFLHFHGISNVAMMSGVVYGSGCYVNGFKHRILERADLFNVLDHAKVDTAFVSPAMVEDLASHPDSGKYLEKLPSLHYGGASLNHAAAQYISKHTNLQDQWGVTETMKLIDLETDPEDYDYMAFDIVHSGLEMRHVTQNIYEMIVHRTLESYPYVTFFHREPEATIYQPGDLWSPHPDPKKAKYMWKFEGRTDDLIPYKDGNNFHPVAYELKHSEHELIRTACLAGTGHRQPVLVVELNDPSLANTNDKRQQIIDKLWEESIIPINTAAPKNGQVSKKHIVIATAEKPFQRNVKGTVARKASLKIYEPEIEAVYQQFGDQAMDVTARWR